MVKQRNPYLAEKMSKSKNDEFSLNIPRTYNDDNSINTDIEVKLICDFENEGMKSAFSKSVKIILISDYKNYQNKICF